LWHAMQHGGQQQLMQTSPIHCKSGQSRHWYMRPWCKWKLLPVPDRTRAKCRQQYVGHPDTQAASTA